MSNAIFPTPQPVTGWNWKLPLKVTPRYSTLVQTPSDNRGELRVSLTQYPVFDFDMEIPYVFGNPANPLGAWAQVIGFYGQMAGQADDWLFDWPGNDTITQPQTIAIGDGNTLSFDMTHAMGGMYELIQNFQSLPIIYVNGVAQSTSTWSLDSFGVLIFATPPALHAPIAWTGSWYYRCRFMEDSLQDLMWVRGASGINDGGGMWVLKTLKFKSLLL